MIDEQVKFLKNTETGAITDAMNLIGVDGWMNDIYPVSSDMKICGRAFTIQFSTVRDKEQKTFNIFEVLDMCEPGDVVVVSAHSTGSTIGENIMHALANQGLAGMVLDGRTRDSSVIATMKTPHFSCGPAIKLAPNFKITAVQVPVSCGGMIVEPGDYIVGDCDGVIALPQARINDVIYQTEMVAKVESELEQALNNHVEMSGVAKISQKKKSPRQPN